VPASPARRAGRVAVAVLAAVPLIVIPSAAAARPRFTPGSVGLGDAYFPLLGNGGYDAKHYSLVLSYQPSTHLLSGTVRMRAVATKGLSRFDLDLSGMKVHGVRLDGSPVRWQRHGPELRITPAHGIRAGTTFTTAVRYSGSPKTVTGSPIVFGSDYGWQYTNDGAFVGDEPNAAHTWFPLNDYPRDKATYSSRITVPTGHQVISNGELRSRHSTKTTNTFVWRETKPMASYLFTLGIGRWRFRSGHTPGGIPELLAVDPTLGKKVHNRHVFRISGAVTDYWAKLFGGYPFTSTGAIVDHVPNVGFSLETQTRPLYGFAPDQYTIAHELAHQWFGDAVSVRSWRDIWLNEGFATFAEFLWNEHLGRGSTYQGTRNVYRQIKASSAFWRQSIADPKRDRMFSQAVYYRGAMTLGALRHRIGRAAFGRLLREWVVQHRYRSATTSQFVALAERVSGQRLGHFFQIWLWREAKPPTFG
jgi:aminopeptidase N